MKNKYNSPFSIAILFFAFATYITHIIIPDLDFTNKYFTPPYRIMEIENNFNLALGLILYIFNYFSHGLNFNNLILDSLILILLSSLIERRVPMLIALVSILAILFCSFIKIFLFPSYEIYGFRILIFTYAFSSLFVALVDGVLNINAIIILYLYIHFLILKNQFNYHIISNYTEIAAAFLASVLIFLERRQNGAIESKEEDFL